MIRFSTSRAITFFLFSSGILIILLSENKQINSIRNRRLFGFDFSLNTIDLGGGKCEWRPPKPDLEKQFKVRR